MRVLWSKCVNLAVLECLKGIDCCRSVKLGCVWSWKYWMLRKCEKHVRTKEESNEARACGWSTRLKNKRE